MKLSCYIALISAAQAIKMEVIPKEENVEEAGEEAQKLNCEWKEDKCSLVEGQDVQEQDKEFCDQF